MTGDELVSLENAEKQIARILAQLELSSGSLVEKVEIRTVDVTSITSKQSDYMMQVRIQLRRLPGHQWGQTK